MTDLTPPAVAAITLDEHGGGVASVSRLVWDVLRRRSRECELVTLMKDGRAPSPLRVGTAARFTFGVRIARIQTARRARWIFFTHQAVARVQAFVPGPLQRPYAVFLHGIEAWQPLSESQQQVLRRAALRVANSGYTALRISQLYPTIGDIAVCPLALPPADRLGDVVTRLDQQWTLDVRPTVVIVGRMVVAERYKGHDQLLEAWRGVVARVPGAQLVIVGDGDDAPRLKAKARALGFEDHVNFTGFVPRHMLSSIYAGASVFAMPSREEGFGLVYVEAMMHGLPCIASTHDAAAEVVVDGETGYLVDQWDTEALASRIVHLLRNPTVRREMGERGLDRVHSQFTFDRFADRLERLIEERLEPHSSSAAGATHSGPRSPRGRR